MTESVQTSLAVHAYQVIERTGLSMTAGVIIEGQDGPYTFMDSGYSINTKSVITRGPFLQRTRSVPTRDRVTRETSE